MPKRKDPKEIKLAQPDRSGPTEKTLLQWAEERELFEQAQARERQAKPASKSKSKPAGSKRTKEGDASGSEELEGEGDGDKSESEEEEEDEAVFTPGQERVLEAVLWAATISTVHFMLDVLVQNQYAMEIDFWRISLRTGQAFLVFLFLLYTLHPHPTATIPLLPRRFHHILRSFIFFVTSCLAGCYLIHTTNTSSHLAIMKRAPTIGCLWLWAVAELDLDLSVASVGVTAGFLFFGGYSIR